LTEDYFQDRYEKIIFQETQKYFLKYDKVPDYAALRIETEGRSDLTENLYKEVSGFLEKQVEPLTKVDYLVNKTEAWCQERAIINAVYQAVNIIGGEDKKTPMTALPDLLSKAIGTSFDKSVGHDYILDAEDRWEFYNRKEDKISTGIEHLDYILRGGIPSKTLGVLMAGTGVGKSLFMCSMSSNLLEAGFNVLYITMEMAEEKISQRIDQNLLNLTQEELDKVSRDSFMKRFDAVKMQTKGQMVVKEYPTKTAHVGHFKALLKELKQKKDFEPDVIFIDYLNICGSATAPKGSNSYTEVKAIAEELRGMAMEFDVPVITATQTNRTGYSDADMDMTSVSESFGLPMTADWFMGIATNDRLKEEGMVRFTQLKNRFGDPADRRNWLLGVDYAKMRVYDLEHQPESIEAQNDAVRNPQTDTSTIMDIKWG
jgi:replicative DNA helicase